MKKINIIVAFLTFHISYAIPSGIFSVTTTEEISDVLVENINSKLKQLPNAKNFTVDTQAEISISKENRKSNIMLLNKLGTISFSKEIVNGVDKLTIYKPNAYFADVTGGNQRTIVIRPAQNEMIYLFPEALFYLATNWDSYINNLQNLSSNKKHRLKVEDSSLQYSDDDFSYFILFNNGQISSIDVLKKSTGEKFSSVAFSYDGNRIIFPSKINVEIYSKDKIQLKKKFTFKLISTVSNIEAKKIFNTEKLGMFKFIDMRFSPPKTYNFDKGIPSKDYAIAVLEIMKFEGLTYKSEADLNAARTSGQSSYINNVKDFFEKND